MAHKFEIPARCTDPNRFEAMVRRMLAVPVSASQEQFRQALLVAGRDALSWYDNRLQAIKDAAVESVPQRNSPRSWARANTRH